MLLLGPGLVRAELNVSGLPDELEANVRALSPLTASSCDSARWRIERLFRDVEQNMRQSLQAFGQWRLAGRRVDRARRTGTLSTS